MENKSVTITPTDLLHVNYCSFGARMWFRALGLDWQKFLVEGLPSEEIEATGDAMAIDLVAKIKKLRGAE